MTLSWASTTDVGRARDRNEDSVWPEPGRGETTKPLIVAVADGMGGHAAGEVASTTAIRAATSVGGSAAVRVQAANLAVIDTAARQSRLSGMGTTLVLAMVDTDGSVEIANVGDSRAYLYSDGDLEQVTNDHSYVAEMVQAGRMTLEEAEHHPYRSVVTRAIGLETAVDVDTHEVTLVTGDRLLLCSDGLTSMLDDSTIAHILDSQAEPAEAARSLVEAANLAGGADNITVVVVDVV
jgi:PPM family protein phosphatase